mgnify:CR=1 FL=1
MMCRMPGQVWAIVAFLCGAVTAVCGSPRVTCRFSGVLAQSQPVEAEPLPFVGVSGLASDPAGRLWTVAGRTLYCFHSTDSKSPTLIRRVSLPSPVSPSLGLRNDGQFLYAIGNDGRVFSLKPEAEKTSPRIFGRIRPGARSFTVAPQGLEQGFAARAKLLVLRNNQVHGWRADGQEAGLLFELPCPPDAKWDFRAICLDPVNGELLAASYYPDNKVYRFKSDGEQVRTDWWPRPVFARRLQRVDRTVWGLTSFGGIALPEKLIRLDDAARVDLSWTYPPTGIARDRNGRMWLGSTQGVVRYEEAGRPGDYRLGGLPGVVAMAVASDGTAVATVQGGGRHVRLYIDDRPHAPLLCNGNEPWRTGRGWTGRASDIAWNGAFYLVTDRIHGRLWQFDPRNTGPHRKAWHPVTPEGVFAQVRHLAVGHAHAWIQDGTSLLHLPPPDFREPGTVRFGQASPPAGPLALAARTDRELYTASSTRLTAWKTQLAKTAWVKRWDVALDGADVADLAVSERLVAVSDRAGKRILLFDTGRGGRLGALEAHSIPGGLAPGAVSLRGRWLLVADTAGDRIVRCRVDFVQ